MPQEKLKIIFEEEAGKYRERIFTPLVTLRACIFQALDGNGSCSDAVARVIAERITEGKDACSADTGAYCRARQRLEESLLSRLILEIGSSVDEKVPAEWKWQRRDVRLVDGSTVSMPDTEENQKIYPQESNQKEGLGFPIARIAILVSLGSATVLNAAIGPYKGKETGETALFRGMFGCLKEDDIVVADKYYCGWFIIALLKAMGVDIVCPLHARRKADFSLGKWLGDGDHIVKWVKPERPDWMDEDTYLSLPTHLEIREIKRKNSVIITTLTDHKHYKKNKVLQLYSDRWQVEVDLKFIKDVMNLNILKGKSPDTVRKEFYIGLIAYNLLRAIMAQTAKTYSTTPRKLSFTCALGTFLGFSERLYDASKAKFKRLYCELLTAINRHKVGNRRGRHEPRAVKRKQKKFPSLSKPRKQLKLEVKTKESIVAS